MADTTYCEGVVITNVGNIPVREGKDTISFKNWEVDHTNVNYVNYVGIQQLQVKIQNYKASSFNIKSL